MITIKICLLLMNFMYIRILIFSSLQYGRSSTCTGVLGRYSLHLKDFVLMALRYRKTQQLETCHEMCFIVCFCWLIFQLAHTGFR